MARALRVNFAHPEQLEDTSSITSAPAGWCAGNESRCVDAHSQYTSFFNISSQFFLLSFRDSPEIIKSSRNKVTFIEQKYDDIYTTQKKLWLRKIAMVDEKFSPLFPTFPLSFILHFSCSSTPTSNYSRLYHHLYPVLTPPQQSSRWVSQSLASFLAFLARRRCVRVTIDGSVLKLTSSDTFGNF